MLSKVSEKHRFVDEGIRERFGVTLRPLDRKHFRRDVELFLEIYNAALAGTWGFEPLSAREIARLAGELKHLIVPELAIVAEVGGEAIGVCFGLLDYNIPIRQSGGRLLPLGWWRLLRAKRTVKRMRIVSANVRPEYQNWGVGITLARGLIEPVLAHGILEAEFSWVLESNDLSRKTLEKGGARKYKTYRIYDRTL
jgi:GNAT superfamily N-acetyltransferase